MNKSTCDFLRDFGFEITSSVPGDLLFGGLYEKELLGVVITYCSQVSTLLRAHGVDHYTLANCRGSEFASVTLCLSDHVVNKNDLSKFYVCATRSRGDLLILTPDASEPST